MVNRLHGGGKKKRYIKNKPGWKITPEPYNPPTTATDDSGSHFPFTTILLKSLDEILRIFYINIYE